MLGRQVHCFVDDPALDGRDLGLVIRVCDIEMNVRDHEQGPLFSSIERFFFVLAATLGIPGRLCRRLLFRRNSLTANCSFSRQTPDAHGAPGGNACRRWSDPRRRHIRGLAIADKDIDHLVELLPMLLMRRWWARSEQKTNFP